MKKIYINIFLCFIILFSIYSAVLIGIGWDEGALIEIARLRLEYLLSFGFADYKALWFSHYYPGTYPVVVMFIISQKLCSGNFSYFKFIYRHKCNFWYFKNC